MHRQRWLAVAAAVILVGLAVPPETFQHSGMESKVILIGLGLIIAGLVLSARRQR